MSKITPRLRASMTELRALPFAFAVVGERTKAMSEDVALTHPLEHLFQRRRRMVDMDHHWQTDFVGYLPGDVEWNEPENCDACKPTRTLTPTIVSRLA
jgi:hypothetical protein